MFDRDFVQTRTRTRTKTKKYGAVSVSVNVSVNESVDCCDGGEKIGMNHSDEEMIMWMVMDRREIDAEQKSHANCRDEDEEEHVDNPEDVSETSYRLEKWKDIVMSRLLETRARMGSGLGGCDPPILPIVLEDIVMVEATKVDDEKMTNGIERMTKRLKK
jgi:hypothetical protein